MPFSAGTRLGSYEILALIGAGGEVYRARDTKLKRDVALKVLPGAFFRDPGRMARFQREAEVLASLNQPNIAHIYGVEERALVMVLVEGETLPCPLPIDDALKCARQMADALEYAHERGVIHRDLKPANIKVTPDGVVKVLDFGLAKAIEEPGPAADNPTNSPTLTLGHTQVGVVMGTAAYMAPEQAAGAKVDWRADIWSFGAVLYEMLSGKRAFGGESVADTLATVMKLDRDWSALPSETPASIRKLVRRCLTKDRKQRLQAIGEARILLENPDGTEVAPQAESLPHGKLPWVIASIVTLALAAVSCGHFHKPPPAPQVIQTTIDAPPKTRITNFTISPDGRYLAMIMTTTGERGAQLWVRPLESLQAQALAGTEGASLPFWSPDSRYIGFFAGGKLKKISVAGGPAQTLCDAVASGGTWNSEGDIVFGAYPGLSRVSALGGVPTKVIEVEWLIEFPTFLPDGRRFLYLDLSAEPGVYLGSLDARPGSQSRRISDDVSNPQYLPPSEGRPHGYILFVREQTLMAQPVDPNTLQAAGDVFPIIEQIYTLAGSNFYDYSISRNGILLHRTGLGGLRQYAVFDRSGKQLSAVGDPQITPGRVALSPDEKRMVSERGVGTKIDLWITELERGTASRFTLNASGNITPVWSPDGKDVAFASIGGGSYDLYRKTANQAGQDELLLRSETLKIPTDWCCDGRFIIFTQSSPGTLSDVFALPVSGDKKPIPLLHSEFNETAGTVSPDGRWLAYISNESRSFEVYVQPFALTSSKPSSGKWQISIGGGRDPHWRGDGRELFYIAPNRKLMAVAVKTDGEGFVRSTPQPLFEVRFFAQSTTISRYAVSGDGKRFLMAADPETSSEAPPLHVTVNWLAGLKR